MLLLDIIQVVITLFLVLFMPGFAWSYIFFKKGEIEQIERIGLSLGLSVALVPLTILWLSSVFGMIIDATNVSLLIFALTLIPVMFFYTRRRKCLSIKRLREPIKSLLKIGNSFSLVEWGLLFSSFLIVFIKWWIPFVRGSFINFGYDLPRHMAIVQVLNSLHMIPKYGFLLYVDSMLAGGVVGFNTIPLLFYILSSVLNQVTNLDLVFLIEFIDLAMLFLSILTVYMLAFQLTKNKTIGILSCLSFATMLTVFPPQPAQLAMYVIIPLVFYSTYSYLDDGGLLRAMMLGVFLGALTTTHSAYMAFTAIVLLILVSSCLLSGKGREYKLRALNILLLISVLFILVSVLYIFVLYHPAEVFVIAYFGIWTVPLIREMEFFPMFFTTLFFSGLLMFIASYFWLRGKLLGNGFHVTHKFVNWGKAIRYFLLIIISLSLITLILRIANFGIGVLFYNELQRDINLAFLLMMIIGLSAQFSLRVYERECFKSLMILLVPLFVGFLSLTFYIPTQGDVIERVIYYAYVPISILASLTLNHIKELKFNPPLRFKIERLAFMRVSLLSLFIIIILLSSTSFLSIRAMDTYYRNNNDTDFIDAVLWLKKQIGEGEHRVAYDWEYAHAFMYLNVKDYVNGSKLPAPLSALEFVRRNKIDYVITNGNEDYWKRVLTEGDATGVLNVSEIYRRGRVVIFRIEHTAPVSLGG